jgi:hypothetical protein
VLLSYAAGHLIAALGNFAESLQIYGRLFATVALNLASRSVLREAGGAIPPAYSPAWLWRPFGGMPSDWVVQEKTALLSDEQRELLPKKIQARLGITIPAVAEIRTANSRDEAEREKICASETARGRTNCPECRAFSDVPHAATRDRTAWLGI